MKKKRLLSWLAYIVAMAVMLSSVFVIDMPAAAEGEELTEDEVFDDEEEYEEEDDEAWDEDDYGIDTVVNFKATKITKNSVILKWDKVEDIDGYEISYKKASSSSWKTIEIESANKCSYVVKKLSTNTKYNFRIRAYVFYEEDDEDYEEDEYYEEEYSEEEYYEDDAEYEDDEDLEEEDEEWDDYEYGDYSKMNLKTLNKKGQGATSAESDTSETAAHSSVKAPVLKTVKSKAAKKVDLKWTKSSKATGYEVYVSIKKASGFKKIGTLKKNSKVSYTAKNLKSGKTYYFKVRAYVKSGKTYSYTKYSKVKKVKVK